MSHIELIHAVKRNDLIAAEKILRAGGNVHETDTQGWTPLFHAAERGNVPMMRLLIDNGANPNHGIENGFTALFAAVLMGHLGAVEVLIRAGAVTKFTISGVSLRNHVQRGYRTADAIQKLLDDAEPA